MVNLRGAFRGLGEALTTIGTQGIAEQQRQASDARLMAREQALASLNQTIRNQDADTAVKRGLAEYDAQTPLVAGRQQKTLAVQEPVQIAAETRAHDRHQQDQAAENTEWTRRNQIQFNNQLREIAVRADTETAQHLREYQMGIGSGAQPRYLEDGSTGTYVAQYPDGHTEDTGVTLRPRANESSDEGGDGGGTTGDQILQTGARAARRSGGTLRARTNSNPGQPPVAGARQAPDGNWYIQRNGRTYRVDR